MGLDYLVQHVWLAVGVWAILYVSDYALTLVGARLAKAAEKHMVSEQGYELTPEFRQDVAVPRIISPLLVGTLLLSCVFLAGFGWISVAVKGFVYFEVVLGAFLLLEVVVHERHFRNIARLAHMRTSKGIKGRITFSHWLSLRLSSVELVVSAVVFLAFFALSGRWFFAGGALACLACANRHWRLSRKETRELPGAEQPSADGMGADA
jgi:hypothetical protein